MAYPTLNRSTIAGSVAVLASPAIVIFLSSNFVNIGNLAFNMIFSRWMGPELFGDLAVVLTIKLALLGILGALSSAVSQNIAATGAQALDQTEQALARINRVCFAALWLALPVIGLALYAGSVSERLDLASPYLLFILLGSVPFCAPLNILRGVALGHMNSAKIVLSANVEMAVRLGLGMVAWNMGFGIEGVVAAIGLSIIAGCAVLFDILPNPERRKVVASPLAKTLGLSALPFAMLQLAQVAALDGDIFLATRYLSDTQTGYVAALSLFQRIQFFACFALAGVLLPSVIIAIREDQSYLNSIVLIGAILVAVSLIVMSVTWIYPIELIGLLVGPEYVAAAPHLWVVAAAAVLFTVNYLIATFLLAFGNRAGVAIVVAGSAVQIGLMIAAVSSQSGDLAELLSTKLSCQGAILAVLFMPLLANHKTQQGTSSDQSIQ